MSIIHLNDTFPVIHLISNNKHDDGYYIFISESFSSSVNAVVSRLDSVVFRHYSFAVTHTGNNFNCEIPRLKARGIYKIRRNKFQRRMSTVRRAHRLSQIMGRQKVPGEWIQDNRKIERLLCTQVYSKKNINVSKTYLHPRYFVYYSTFIENLFK